jgi:hypothetical protein
VNPEASPRISAGTTILGLQDTYFFDPFPLSIQGQNYLLFEVTGVRDGMVEIGIVYAPVTLSDGPEIHLDQAHWLYLDERESRPGVRFSTSYPFVLAIENDKYLLTEQWHRNEGTKLAKIQGGDRLSLAPAVSIGPRLFDPNLSIHDGLYWLYGTDANYRLKVYFAESAMGPFIEHRCSGAVSDRQFSRNAGPEFCVGSTLVSPRQDCSRTYGESVSLYEIEFSIERGLALHPLGERTVPVIGASAKDMPTWLSEKAHHLCPAFDWASGLVVLDGGFHIFRYSHGWVPA